MGLRLELEQRANGQCELCSTKTALDSYTVPPKNGDEIDVTIAVCSTCSAQFEDMNNLDSNHWRCLNDSMWSEVPAVQVMAYKLLKAMKEDWATDLINMMYLDEVNLEWAQSESFDSTVVHKDSNGQVLQTGDSVVLVQDLNVKGANFIAKRGTAVRRISLVRDNAEHIEGKINGQNIVILTKFVKKT